MRKWFPSSFLCCSFSQPIAKFEIRQRRQKKYDDRNNKNHVQHFILLESDYCVHGKHDLALLGAVVIRSNPVGK